MSLRFPVSLAIIVKDGAGTLAHCLRSAAPWVSEMVVADTGSSDESPAIARSFGARVLDFPWRDDFSAARNHVLEVCSQPWILVLDADEALRVPEGPEGDRLWSQALGRSDVAGFHLEHRSFDASGKVRSRIQLLRLFVRCEEVRFRYPVHEQIAYSVVRYAMSRGWTVGSLEAVIEHTGYASHAEDSIARNLRILRQAVARDPGDSFLQYNLGKTLLHGDAATALAHLDRARRLVNAQPEEAVRGGYRADLYHFLIEALCRLERPQDAVSVADEAIAACGDVLDLSYDRAVALLRAGSLESAREAFQSCLGRDEEVSPQFVMPGAGSVLAMDGLAQVLCRLGEFDAGIAWFRRAIEACPDAHDARYNLAVVYRVLGEPAKELEIYHEILALSPAEERAWRQGAELLEGLGASTPLRWWTEALRPG